MAVLSIDQLVLHQNHEVELMPPPLQIPQAWNGSEPPQLSKKSSRPPFTAKATRRLLPKMSLSNTEPATFLTTVNTSPSTNKRCKASKIGKKGHATDAILLQHRTVEKKRRVRMNEKVEALKTLIPSCSANAAFPTSIQQPIHQLNVLQAAVDYINELHTFLRTTLSKEDPILKQISISPV